MFEKKKIKFSLENKKDKLIKISDNITVNYISYIGVIIIFLLSIFILNKINVENFKIYEVIKNTSYANLSEEEKNKIQLIQKNREKLKIEKLELELKKKTDSDKKNILIIGRGGDGNDAPELTDSIILLSYYKKKNHISLLSIPRDLYIDYDMVDNQGKKIKGKINALYVTDLEKTQNREKSIKKLGNKIEEITNEEIDFYINIDFRGFIKLIDLIGGVKIDVQKTLVDEEYPDKNHGFQTFILRKGKWLLDGKIALKYVRSRKNTGGDFGRSNRQQQVIKSLKEKLLSSQYLASPSKIEELYNIFDKYIVTDIGIVDFVKLATSIKLQNHLNFYSSTLNTSCILIDECEKGGFLFYPQRTYFGGQSVLLSGKSTYLNLGNYNKIHTYSELVFNSPEMFDEKFKISIFSNSKNKKDALLLQQELKKYGAKINLLESVTLIPNVFKDFKGGFGKEILKESKSKNTTTLFEYNKLKKGYNLEQIVINNSKKIENLLGKEAHNKNTKIIVNGIGINSNTIKFLKKHLQLDKSDIITNIDGPKYTKDKNTRIEILFKK